MDGLRAIACFTVIFYHINMVMRDNNTHVWHPDVIGPITAALAFDGWCGVTLFFVLSGFLLFMPYARALLYDGEWPSWRRYYVRRIFRIWPGYFVSLLLLIVFFHSEYLQPQHWFDLSLFLTFFMDSTPQTVQAINGPFWTLAVEWQFYLILPLLALALRVVVRRGAIQHRLWLIILCLGCVALWGMLTRAWGQSWVMNAQQPSTLPPLIHTIAFFFFYGQHGKFQEDFAVGMVISVFYVLSQDKRRSHDSALIGFFKRHSGWFWAFGILWLFFLGIWFLMPSIETLLQPWISQFAVFGELAYAIGYGCCIIALLFGPAYQRRFLECELLCWLGQLSYGLYIWHLPILHFFEQSLADMSRYWPSILAYGLNWGCFLGIVVPFCYFFYLFIERPGINIGAKLLNGGAHRSEVAVSGLSGRVTPTYHELDKRTADS